jgi:hypothetical protein
LFALLLLSVIVVAAVAAELKAKRHDRSRIAAGYVPLPAHERPYDAQLQHHSNLPLWSRR